MEGRAVFGLMAIGERVAVGWFGEDQRWFWSGGLDDKQEVLRAIGREAADPESTFTWDQAAILTVVVRLDWPKHAETRPNGCKLRDWVLWLLGVRREP